MHPNLVGHKDQIRKPDGTIGVAKRGGMARMKTMIDVARKSNPNTVVMNIGRHLSWWCRSLYSLGNAVADPLNALGIDVGVIGNWNYNFTPRHHTGALRANRGPGG